MVSGIEIVFTDCHLLKYLFAVMVSTAYRIKEMGDGFICSVDFPFKNPFAHTSEKTAFDLALSFIILFKSIVLEKGLHDKIFCAIGIAGG